MNHKQTNKQKKASQLAKMLPQMEKMSTMNATLNASFSHCTLHKHTITIWFSLQHQPKQSKSEKKTKKNSIMEFTRMTNNWRVHIYCTMRWIKFHVIHHLPYIQQLLKNSFVFWGSFARSEYEYMRSMRCEHKDILPETVNE